MEIYLRRQQGTQEIGLRPTGGKIHHATPTVGKVAWVNATGGAAGGRVTPAKVSLTLSANPEFETISATLVSRKNNLLTVMVDASSKDKPRPNAQRDRTVRRFVDIGLIGGQVRVKVVARKADGTPGRQLGSIHEFTSHIPMVTRPR